MEVLAQMVNKNVESDVYNLSHLSVSSMDMVEALKVIYPGLETILLTNTFRYDLKMECDGRLAPLLPDDTSIVQDLQKFKELFTFNLPERAASAGSSRPPNQTNTSKP